MNEFMKRDLLGRLKVIYALQMKNPSLIIKSMDLYSKYDLEVYDSKKDKTFYLEIKDRDCYEDTYDTAFLNIEKYDSAKPIADNWFFVNVYKDGTIDMWKPYEMPETGITKEIHYISRTTVGGGRKIPQERYCLNFNDVIRKMKSDLDVKPRNSEEPSTGEGN